MEQLAFQYFLFFLHDECESFRIGYGQLIDALRAIRAEVQKEKPSDRIADPLIAQVWHASNSILMSAAKISKCLSPLKTGDQDRGRELRAKLGIADSSPLYSRDVRNHFEHFDERIDVFARDFQKSPSHVMESFIVPDQAIPSGAKVLRHFELEKMEIRFGEDTFKLLELKEAIEELHSKLHTFSFPSLVA